jgi:lipopolysaccharide biosynthesis protein
MAKKYGLSGFCFYWYWFGGRRILEKPIELFFKEKVDFPFCFCWANENWTRTWDGLEKHVLLGQKHSADDDLSFMNAMLPYFQDERYIKEDGKPVLLVYRVDLFPDMKATAERWRTAAKAAGFPDLHLCAVQFYGIDDPRPYGFDAAVEFPPHKFLGSENGFTEYLHMTNKNFRGGISDYRKIVAQALTKDSQEYTLYRGVMPSWDNTARRQHTPHVIHKSSPELYQFWLSEITKRTIESGTKYIFINAWNEWGEGCHLEPDLKHEHKYLEATFAGLNGAPPAPDAQIFKMDEMRSISSAVGDTRFTYREVVGLAQENRLLLASGFRHPSSGRSLTKRALRFMLRPLKPAARKLFSKLKATLSDA